MKKCDLHVHSEFSPDSRSTIDQICDAAIAGGIEVIALTDHFEVSENDDFNYRYYLENQARRAEAFAQAREKYAGRVKLLYGAELAQPHLYPRIYENFFAGREFDFILGSVHILPGERDVFTLNYDSPEFIDSVMKEYFEQVIKLIEFGGFDSVAHFDLPLRMLEGKLEKATVIKYENIVNEALAAAAEKKIGIEINTRGLFCWQKDVGPENWVLKKFRQLGGEYITTGSDAHLPQHVGRGIERAAEAALEAGFSQLAYFEKRKPVLTEI